MSWTGVLEATVGQLLVVGVIVLGASLYALVSALMELNVIRRERARKNGCNPS